jgi:XTP/dITP diphosphohydrolase
MIKICFATNNAHKLEEVQALVANQIDIISLADINCIEELPETTDTIEGNALQKAEFVFEKYHIPCFADDSGLEVHALAGAPGVHSAYYAGPQRSHNDNIHLLLKNLEGQTNRQAQFKTVIALIGFGQPHLFEGIVRGNIIITPRGSGGFGYDPVFVPEGYDKTFAEMTLQEKNTLSHRSKAVAALVAYLKNL